jgi:hypothetical protein
MTAPMRIGVLGGGLSGLCGTSGFCLRRDALKISEQIILVAFWTLALFGLLQCQRPVDVHQFRHVLEAHRAVGRRIPQAPGQNAAQGLLAAFA